MYEVRTVVLDLRSDKGWSMWFVVIRKGGCPSKDVRRLIESCCIFLVKHILETLSFQ